MERWLMPVWNSGYSHTLMRLPFPFAGKPGTFSSELHAQGKRSQTKLSLGRSPSLLTLHSPLHWMLVWGNTDRGALLKLCRGTGSRSPGCGLLPTCRAALERVGTKCRTASWNRAQIRGGLLCSSFRWTPQWVTKPCVITSLSFFFFFFVLVSPGRAF